MPLPKPNGNEKEKDFIQRCMGDEVMTGEYPDEKQRAAVCYTQWKELSEKADLKINTAEIKDIEILDVGTWNGSRTVKVSETDMDEIIKNYNDKILEPVLTLDHDVKLTEKVKKALSVSSLGFVSQLKRDGKKLIASFKQVPSKVAELIQAGMLKKRSVEFWEKGRYVLIGGKQFDNVLKAVTFTGDIPAVNTLNDEFEVIFDVLLKNESEQLEGYTILKEKKSMEKIEIDKKEYDELVGLKSKETDFKKIEDENVSLKSKMEKLEFHNAELLKFKESALLEKVSMLKKEAESYVEDLIKKEKLMPKFKDAYVADYIEKSKDDSAISLFKADCESRGKVVNLGAIGGNASATVDLKNINYQDENKLNEAIEFLMSKEAISWQKAHDKIMSMREV